MTSAQQVAAELLRIGAVFLRPDEPFVWASGILSPVYCDNRLVYSDVRARRLIAHAFEQCIATNYPNAEGLFGTSTSGIGYAAIAAWMLDLPMGYVRGGAKTHGRENQIEGKLLPGQKVVVIEDLISTGGSVLEVVETLRATGAEVLGIVSVFTYHMRKGLERFAAANVINCSLTDFDTLVVLAAETNYILPAQKAELLAFRDAL